MVSAQKLFAGIFAAILLVGISPLVWGDVTGTFGTNIIFTPQTTASEISLIDFDVINSLDITVSISGLSTTLHSHFGIAGVEDAIITLDGVMGFLSFNGQLVFGRFAFGSITPFYDELHFISKTLTAEMGIAGVSFINIAQFRDTNAFISQSTAYAFGDAILINGQTLSGISLTAETGICLQQGGTAIKHHDLGDYEVNPDCATEPKPDLLFDFENIYIENVPLALGVTSNSAISCLTITACELVTSLTFSGAPIPFTAFILIENLLELDFGAAVIELTSGPATLSLFFGANGSLGLVVLDLFTTLNPDSNPASLALDATVTPGIGVTDAELQLIIERAGLSFGATALFAGGATIDFSEIVFELATTLPRAMGNLGMEAAFQTAGLSRAEIALAVNF